MAVFGAALPCRGIQTAIIVLVNFNFGQIESAMTENYQIMAKIVVVCTHVSMAWWHTFYHLIYSQGIGSNKDNSVLDTLNCIKHIHSLRLSTPALSVLHSVSSGGLIAARAAQALPGVVNKLVLRFPFLDLHSAMSDPGLTLSSEGREEWGCGSVCPVSSEEDLNSEVFISVAGRDRRAPPWHPANYIASLRNKERVHVNFIKDADHLGFGEEAYKIETSFILDDKSNSSTFWDKLKENLFSR